MKTTIIKTTTLLFAAVTASASAFTPYTDRGGFSAAAVPTVSWDFENLPGGTVVNVPGPDGTTILKIGSVPGVPVSTVFPTVTTLNGKWFFINPEPAHAFDFSNPVTAFGISVIWEASNNPGGINVVAYDGSGNPVGTTTATTADALSGPFAATTASGQYYEGFLGFTSSTPVSSIHFGQSDGSVYYDNALWTPTPEPTSAALLSLGTLLLAARRRRSAQA